MNIIYKYFRINYFLFIGLTILIIGLFSCSTEVELIDKSKDFYIVNAILNADSSIQYVTVSKNYFIEGTDPYENIEDPFIKDAEVYLTDSENNVINFIPDSMPRPEGARYNSNLNYYKAENFIPVDKETYNLNVNINNEVELYSDVYIPPFNKIFIDAKDVYPIFGLPEFRFNWSFIRELEQSVLYKPDLFVNYYFNTDEGLEKRRLKIPFNYVNDSPDSKKIFPEITRHSSTYFRSKVIDRAIESIEPDSTARQDYFLESLEFDLTVMDVDLGTYYVLSKNVKSGFTVLLDYNDYTNIENGLGIFGVVKNASRKLAISQSYALQLGFKHKLMDL